MSDEEGILGIICSIIGALLGGTLGFTGVGYLLAESAWFIILGAALGAGGIGAILFGIAGLFFGVWLGEKLS